MNNPVYFTGPDKIVRDIRNLYPQGPVSLLMQRAELRKLAWLLRRKFRFGNMLSDPHRWTVLHHSLYVGHLLSLEYPDDYVVQLDGLTHDIAEGIFGDIPTPLKQICPALVELENALIEQIDSNVLRSQFRATRSAAQRTQTKWADQWALYDESGELWDDYRIMLPNGFPAFVAPSIGGRSTCWPVRTEVIHDLLSLPGDQLVEMFADECVDLIEKVEP